MEKCYKDNGNNMLESEGTWHRRLRDTKIYAQLTV